jgi:hypothetical protein
VTDKDKGGIIAGLVMIVALIVGFYALMKMVVALIPVLLIGAVVGGLLWLKAKS